MNQNSLIVFTGPMFSGKTLALVNAGLRASYAQQEVQAFIPVAGLRNKKGRSGPPPKIIFTRIKTKNGEEAYIDFPVTAVASLEELEDQIRYTSAKALLSKTKVATFLFDEVQFLQQEAIPIIERVLDGDYARSIITRIFASGLDMDAWKKPFNVTLEMIARANEVHKFTAVCFACGADAIFTQKIAGSANQRVEAGDSDIYEARCRQCHTVPE